MTWFGICVTYTRFYSGFKLQGLDRSQLPYASKLQPYAAWYGLVSCLVICFVRVFPIVCAAPEIKKSVQFSGFAVFLKGNWTSADFVTSYLPLALFPILYVGARLWFKTPPVPLHQMDFVSGLKEIEADTYVRVLPRMLGGSLIRLYRLIGTMTLRRETRWKRSGRGW